MNNGETKTESPLTITGTEEGLRFLRSQFPICRSNEEIRAVLQSAIFDAQTWGESALDLSELSGSEINQIKDELNALDNLEDHGLKMEQGSTQDVDSAL